MGVVETFDAMTSTVSKRGKKQGLNSYG